MLFIQRICRFLPPHCPRSVQHLSIFSGTITLEMWKQKANRIIWKIKRNKKGDDGLLYWYHGRELVNVMCDRDLPCFFFFPVIVITEQRVTNCVGHVRYVVVPQNMQFLFLFSFILSIVPFLFVFQTCRSCTKYLVGQYILYPAELVVIAGPINFNKLLKPQPTTAPTATGSGHTWESK